VSPLLADLAGLPPTLIQVGVEEILRNDSRRLAEGLTQASVCVLLREFPRMWHDFQLYAGVVPEATLAMDEMARFIDGKLVQTGRECHATNDTGNVEAKPDFDKQTRTARRLPE
jgi:acetyl esterase/lipase